MTLHNAKEILAAKKDCVENQIKSLCNRECDNCELCYCQGTYGEQVEALDIVISMIEKSDEYVYEEDAEHCYECGGYGDDYSYDEDTNDLASNCDDCPYNNINR